MSITRFLGAFGIAKATAGAESITVWLAKLDPKTASAAQMKLLRDKQHEYAEKLVTAKRALDKESAEAKAAEQNVERALKALATLKAKCDALEDQGAKAPILQQAAVIAAEIDRMKPVAARERAEAESAVEMVSAIQKLYDLMTEKVNQGEGKMKAAEQRLTTAKAKKEHAAMMAELNGEAEKFTGIDTAFDALSQAAEDAERDADVIRMTARKPNTAANDAITEALGEGKPSAVKDPFAVLAA